MTFRDVIIKNLLSHTKRYLSYFFCSSFTIMLFFIYATLYFNSSFLEYAKETEFIFMVNMGIATVFVFSVFFIIYAHDAFIKSRTSEFALFLTLGLTKKNIGRMIWLENLIILAASLTTGLLSGALFSRLFFVVIAWLIKDVPLNYVLDYRSFVVTLVIFLVIYVIAITASRRAITGLSIVQLLKKSKEGSKNEGRISIGILGILIFLGALVLILVAAPQKGFSNRMYMYMVYAGLSFTSLYLILSHFGSLFFRFIKGDKKRYYRRLLSFSQMEYSFNQNKKIIFILSLLSAMILFFVASPFALLSISKQMAVESHYSDIEFVQLADINGMEEGKLQELLNQGNATLLGEETMEFLALSYGDDGKEVEKPVISEKLYRQLNEGAVEIGKGEILQLITTWVPGYDELKGEKELTFTTNGISKGFKISGKVGGKGISSTLFPSKTTLVLCDEDYQELKNRVDSSNIAIVRLFDYKNWEKTDSIIVSLQKNLSNPSMDYPVGSVLEGYRLSKSTFSMMIFFTSFMGFLFFISSGSILFFKQYGETQYYKVTFKKLAQIGMEKRDLLKLYASSQKWIYFTPLFFGTIIGFAFIYMTTFVMGGGDTIVRFFQYSVIVSILYAVFQMGYYLVSLMRFQKNVLEKL